MISKTSTWFPVALMLLLAALTYWLDLTVGEAGGARDRASGSEPDFIIENFRVARMNASGFTDYVLSATRMEHSREDDATRVTAPLLMHYAPGAPPVRLDAKRGVVTGNGDVTEFYDNVVVRREAGGDQAALLMKTEYLKVFPDRAFASSDRAVTITQGESVLTGNGIEIDNNARVFRLLGEVHGTFHRAAK
jgi:lipopolysaccharide export system protein LptC